MKYIKEYDDKKEERTNCNIEGMETADRNREGEEREKTESDR